jgi:hypothetical protein
MLTRGGSDRPSPGGGLSIEKIVAAAQKVEKRVATFVSKDSPLARVAADTVETARLAGERIRRMGSPLSLPKIRLYLLIIGAASLAWWVYATTSSRGTCASP